MIERIRPRPNALWLLLATSLLLAGPIAAHDWQPGDPVNHGVGGNGQEGAPWFFDDFDAYADGSQMHGQGGWKGWANAPAAGALVSSAQSFSGPQSVDILGASDLVHEFSGFTSGMQTITAWQYIPGNFAGVTYFIVLNSYDDACATCNWSVQVNFDGGTGLMTDDSSFNTMPFVTDQWAEIRIEVDLDADTQTFYYNGAMLFTGVWNGYQSGAGTGADAIAAIDLFANNASSVFYDDVSVGVPPPDISPLEVPTLGSWGLVAFALLLAAGTVVLLRRRTATIS